jgi:hypothetical protein
MGPHFRNKPPMQNMRLKGVIKMPRSIRLYMKDDRIINFPHEQRPGGSYTNTVRYEGEFVIIKDPWDKETAYPAADVSKVKVDNHR